MTYKECLKKMEDDKAGQHVLNVFRKENCSVKGCHRIVRHRFWKSTQKCSYHNMTWKECRFTEKMK